MKKIFIFVIVLLSIGSFNVFAQTPPGVPNTPPPGVPSVPPIKVPNIPPTPSKTVSLGLKNPLKPELNSIPKIINAILDGIIIPIAVPIFILAIIWTGIMFVIARGKPEDIKNAKNALKWTLIGGAVILGAKLISAALSGTISAITGTVIK